MITGKGSKDLNRIWPESARRVRRLYALTGTLPAIICHYGFPAELSDP